MSSTKLIWLNIYLDLTFLSFITGSASRSKSTEGKTIIAPTATPATTSKAQTKAEIKEKKAESKKKKDPHGLKRPLSAYMLFNNSKRPLIKQEYPGKFSKTILLSRFSTFWECFDFLILNLNPSFLFYFSNFRCLNL